MPLPSNEARSFQTSGRFRAWLARNHDRAAELVVRCYMVQAAARGMTYLQALEEALCLGWIDGVRHAIDRDSFTVRFTPRKPRSVWSRANVARVEALIQAGRTTAPGLARFRAREEARTGVYSFERRAASLPPALERRFRAACAAWAYFQAQPPWYRRTSVFWIMSAKRDETRLRRLTTLIECCTSRKWIPALRRK